MACMKKTWLWSPVVCTSGLQLTSTSSSMRTLLLHASHISKLSLSQLMIFLPSFALDLLSIVLTFNSEFLFFKFCLHQYLKQNFKIRIQYPSSPDMCLRHNRSCSLLQSRACGCEFVTNKKRTEKRDSSTLNHPI